MPFCRYISDEPGCTTLLHMFIAVFTLEQVHQPQHCRSHVRSVLQLHHVIRLIYLTGRRPDLMEALRRYRVAHGKQDLLYVPLQGDDHPWMQKPSVTDFIHASAQLPHMTQSTGRKHDRNELLRQRRNDLCGYGGRTWNCVAVARALNRLLQQNVLLV